LITLFISILLGLILLVGVIVYYTWKARTARKFAGSDGIDSVSPQPVQKETTIIQREVVKIPCKYCGTLVDPVQDQKCPNCGAAVI
jgi:rubrerythrin